MFRVGAAIALAALLSGCAAGSGASSSRSASRPDSGAFRAPQMQRIAGLEGVMGARAEALVGALGKPRIDLSEGDARKLQFASDDCVLDIFLYPLRAGAEPVATHVDARRRSDGREVDTVRCLSEVARR